MQDIMGYEGLYSVTSCGKLWSHRSGRFLKPQKDKDGYLRVALCRDGKMKVTPIHRLVLATYHPSENMDNLQVNHKSERKDENWLSNLEWVTPKENSNHGTRNSRMVLSRKKPVLCVETGKVFESLTEAANSAGAKEINISRVCRKIPSYITAGGFHWAYSNEGKAVTE